MLKKILFGFLLFGFMISAASALDDQAFIPQFGDEETYFGGGDLELGNFFAHLQIPPIPPAASRSGNPVQFDTIDLKILEMKPRSLNFSFFVKNMGYYKYPEVIYQYIITDTGNNQVAFLREQVMLPEAGTDVVKNLSLMTPLEEGKEYILDVKVIYTEDYSTFAETSIHFKFSGEMKIAPSIPTKPQEVTTVKFDAIDLKILEMKPRSLKFSFFVKNMRYYNFPEIIYQYMVTDSSNNQVAFLREQVMLPEAEIVVKNLSLMTPLEEGEEYILDVKVIYTEDYSTFAETSTRFKFDGEFGIAGYLHDKGIILVIIAAIMTAVFFLFIILFKKVREFHAMGLEEQRDSEKNKRRMKN
ncbi:MAG: hypothetical protein V1648_03700 [Candidatus Aenigmatarchaeota archaeon]